METTVDILIVFHVFIAVVIIALVLVQHGKGAAAGAAFGGGSSTTMFGSQGAMPFLMKLTGLLVALFFATSLTLTHLNFLKGKPATNTSVTSTSKISAPKAKQSDNIEFPSMNVPSQKVNSTK